MIVAVCLLMRRLFQILKSLSQNQRQNNFCQNSKNLINDSNKIIYFQSPVIKSAMMDVTGKLIDGVVSLTKLMAHGAMHEACLIEVIRNIEDEAFTLVESVRVCVYTNNTFMQEVKDYIKDNNATVLDIERKDKSKKKEKDETDEKDTDLDKDKETKTVDKEGTEKPTKEEDVKHMKELIRRMLADNKANDIDSSFKTKLAKLQQDLAAVDANELVKKDKSD